jgi:hypothetical protein
MTNEPILSHCGAHSWPVSATPLSMLVEPSLDEENDHHIVGATVDSGYRLALRADHGRGLEGIPAPSR